MKPTPAQVVAGLKASYALRDSGDPARGLKPISFTGNPTAHVEVIGEAMLATVKARLPAGVLAGLLQIRGDVCENFTDGLGACYRAGRSPSAQYGADRCCTACIADAILTKGKIHG